MYDCYRFRIVIIISLLLILSLSTTSSSAHIPSQIQSGTTERASVASDGTQGNSSSYNSSISADGRYVAFVSYASNLVSGDTNNYQDVFAHDLQTGETTRVSVSSSGEQGNGDSCYHFPCISLSADGRYLAFKSYASNLVSGDTNGWEDIFVHDRQTGETTRVSVSSSGEQGNFYSFYPSISTDGRYVAFASAASNLVSGDTNGREDIFVHDRQTGETTSVSVSSSGEQGNWESFYPSISADGRYVAFDSYSDNLVSGDTNGDEDIFVHDRQTGETTRASVSSMGEQANNASIRSSISFDGRYVSFESLATNLVSGDTNGFWDIFVHDRQTGETTRVSVSSSGEQGNSTSWLTFISADGRFVVFNSGATNLVSGDTNGVLDTFVHDRQTAETTRVSVSSSGEQGNDSSGAPSMSDDGRYVSFQSIASNLVSGDTNGYTDVFVHDRGGGIGYSISGHISDSSGNPIPGVSVSAGSYNAVTDNQGYYSITGLPAGNYTIAPALSGYSFSPNSRNVSLPPDRHGYDFIAIRDAPPCSVPFFSQRDDRWIDYPLRSNGACSPSCNSIGTCGCTLTSATMLFDYYGASLTPPVLSDCMGNRACPFYWGAGAGCSNGHAHWVNKYSFSWDRLDKEINLNHHPVILGMHKKSNPNSTHWILVTNGSGSDPRNYLINDPWFLDGQNMHLSDRSNSYDFDSIAVYSGTPSCQITSNLTNNNSDIYQPPFISGYNSLFVSVDNTITTAVTGEVNILRIDDITMTVQLIAQSELGNITEMMVWTENITNTTWQPFSTLIELPLSEFVYAQFKDDYGTLSDISSDTIYPANSPLPPLVEIVLPVILNEP